MSILKLGPYKRMQKVKRFFHMDLTVEQTEGDKCKEMTSMAFSLYQYLKVSKGDPFDLPRVLYYIWISGLEKSYTNGLNSDDFKKSIPDYLKEEGVPNQIINDYLAKSFQSESKSIATFLSKVNLIKTIGKESETLKYRYLDDMEDIICSLESNQLKSAFKIIWKEMGGYVV